MCLSARNDAFLTLPPRRLDSCMPASRRRTKPPRVAARVRQNNLRRLPRQAHSRCREGGARRTPRPTAAGGGATIVVAVGLGAHADPRFGIPPSPLLRQLTSVSIGFTGLCDAPPVPLKRVPLEQGRAARNDMGRMQVGDLPLRKSTLERLRGFTHPVAGSYVCSQPAKKGARVLRPPRVRVVGTVVWNETMP
jgi:hypothetical protein